MASELVASKLVESRGAHLAYRYALTTNDRAAARLELARASSLRQDAHDLDPSHTDPAWLDDVAPHADLMAFYAEQLAR